LTIEILNTIPRKKKENLIVLGVSSNLIFAAACAIQDLKRVNFDASCDILLVTDKISKRDYKILTQRFQCYVGKYHPPFSGIRFSYSKCVRMFTPLVFSKYECLKFLKHYEKVIWMDNDIVISQNIDELLEDTKFGLRALKSPQTLNDCFYSNREESYFREYGIGTGLMVFNQNFPNPESTYNEFIQITNAFMSDLYLPEQGVLNMTLGKHNIEVDWLSMDTYAAHPSTIESSSGDINPKILHSFGSPKFWSGLQNEQWKGNYDTWRVYGGSQYRPSRNRFKTIKYRAYDNCLKMVNKIQILIH